MGLKTLEGKHETPSGQSIYYLGRDLRDLRSYIRVENDTLSFKIQDGPVKEAGLNGCQVTDIIEVAKMIIEGLNKDFPCRENAVTIMKLEEALMWQGKRTADRERRNVEGHSRS